MLNQLVAAIRLVFFLALLGICVLIGTIIEGCRQSNKIDKELADIKKQVNDINLVIKSFLGDDAE